METICLQCGDGGFDNAFVHCVRCLDFAVHRYCLDVIPRSFDEFVHWICDDCVEMTQRQFVVNEHNARGFSGVGSKENVVAEHRVCEDSLEESYHALNKRKDCQESSSKQIEEEGEDSLLEDDDSSDDITLKELMNKKRKYQKLQATLQKENLHKKREKSKPSNKSYEQSHEEHTTLYASKHANGMSDSKRRTKDKLNWGNKSWFKRRCSLECCASDDDLLSVSRNGSLRSSKKQGIGTSLGAIAQEQMCRIKSAQTLEKNEVSELGNQIANICLEVKNVNTSNNHTDKKESEDRKEKISVPSESCNSYMGNQKVSSNLSAAHVKQPIWRGSFKIWNKNHDILDGLVAHMSIKACQKVFEAASQFQPVLHLEKLPISEAWPRSFEATVLTSDIIALYFFPTKISKCEFDCLVKEMINKELALKALVQNAELLIFPSTELPLLSWRYQGKYYLWGVFKGKKSTPQSHS